MILRNADLAKHPGCVFEGVLPLKIRDEVKLDDWLFAVIIPEINRETFAGHISEELRDRVYYLTNDCRDIWEWSEKVYEFVRKI